MDTSSWRTELLNEACRPYRRAGPGLFAYFFARGNAHARPRRDVLNRVRTALPAGGLLLLRIGDVGGGLKHRCGRWSTEQ